MGPNKYVQLMFAAGGLLVAFLLSKAGDWGWSYFSKPNDLVLNGTALLVGVVGAFVLYRNEKFFTGAQDITRELEKVTWPTRKETSNATVVVLITVIISALVLSAMDAFWSFVTGRILS